MVNLPSATIGATGIVVVQCVGRTAVCPFFCFILLLITGLLKQREIMQIELMVKFNASVGPPSVHLSVPNGDVTALKIANICTFLGTLKFSMIDLDQVWRDDVTALTK